MIDTDKYEGHTEGPWTAEYGDYTTHVTNSDGVVVASVGFELDKDGQLIADAPLLLAEVKRLQSEPTVTVDDYHKKGHLYITVRFPDGDEYVGLVEKWEGEEE